MHEIILHKREKIFWLQGCVILWDQNVKYKVKCKDTHYHLIKEVVVLTIKVRVFFIRLVLSTFLQRVFTHQLK